MDGPQPRRAALALAEYLKRGAEEIQSRATFVGVAGSNLHPPGEFNGDQRRDPEFKQKMAEVLCVYREVKLIKKIAAAAKQEPSDAVAMDVSGSSPSPPTSARNYACPNCSLNCLA
jgi:hypothetical protein